MIEELLEGPEVSLFAICDGREALPLAPARDYKRAYDGDEGPEHGWHGCICAGTGADDGELERLVDGVHQPVLEELARRGRPFVGLLYAGLMLTADGPEGARVQLPLRRSRDPGRAATRRG